MSSPSSPTSQDIIAYIQSAVERLPRLWSDENVNRRGLRAAFRRWRPGPDEQPTMEMRSAIWSYLGAPSARGDGSVAWSDADAAHAVDRAAAIVALRAVSERGSSEHGVSFGAALHGAGLSDLRLMRLLTTPASGRLEAVRRAMQYIDRIPDGIRWDLLETRRFHDFLYGGDEAAQRSATKWAADFFSSRGATNDDSAPAKTESASTESAIN